MDHYHLLNILSFHYCFVIKFTRLQWLIQPFSKIVVVQVYCRLPDCRGIADFENNKNEARSCITLFSDSAESIF